jgi:quinol monooxygenase YgiN
MSDVHLTGQLVCKNENEARIVTVHLPEHIESTRAEPGCVSFTVTPSDDPLIWTVEEHFEDRRVFELHQERVAASEWGRVTADIERRYSIDGLSR